ncbi:MAG: hypothetical protein NZ805_04760 [Armatimonadetes bacterium]|nr:hypothetical protein [Armatimonadota bacterium]MDW8027251.1 glycosyl hydrolase family 28-related protein [Armatimonadota bacterium]
MIATDFPSIQAALDEAGKRGGGEVFIPAGVYEIERTLKASSNVTLRSAGSATVLKATAQIGENSYPDNRVISNADVEVGNAGIVIKDLVVDGGPLGEHTKREFTASVSAIATTHALKASLCEGATVKAYS